MNLRRVRGAVVCALLAVGVVLGVPVRAEAHALLQRSEPVAGAMLDRSPAMVTLVFGEQPDPGLSAVRVLDSSGASVARGHAQAVADDPLALRAPLGELPRGAYTVSWRTVSAVDGHLATGSFAFGVGVAPNAIAANANSSSGSPGASPVGVAGRWLLYLGLVLALGAGFVGAATFTQAPAPCRRLLTLGCAGAIAGTLAIAAVQVADSGVGIGRLLGSAVGGKLLLRFFTIADLGVIAAATWFVRAPRLGRPLLGAAGVAAAGAMVADVLSSHAAAGSGARPQIAAQAVHVIAVGLWIGGLAALLMAIRGEPSDDKARAVRRFSASAAVALVAVVITGTLRALASLDAWSQLASTGFGRLVVVKVVLVALLAALGAMNRWRNVPVVSERLGPLRRIGSAEVLAGAAALLAAAGLVNLAPPSSARPRVEATPIVRSAADFGTTTRVRLEVSPGFAGFNHFRAKVAEYDTGAPVRAGIVRLTFVAVSRPDVGQSTLELKMTRPGLYEADGANVSIYGSWRVRVLVQRSGTSVEVPLTFTTRLAPQRVDIARSPGTPDVFTVHLAEDRRLQVYLDPGKAGPNELHVTYLDATGAPLDVTSASVRRAEPRFSTEPPLTIRHLERGHFVADASVVKGSAIFEIVGTTAAGALLPAVLRITVR